jgi:hypothetical protein
MNREKVIELLEEGKKELEKRPMWTDEMRACALKIHTALAELREPKCQTCGGSGEVTGSFRDSLTGAEYGDDMPCPDCQKPERTELTDNEILNAVCHQVEILEAKVNTLTAKNEKQAKENEKLKKALWLYRDRIKRIARSIWDTKTIFEIMRLINQLDIDTGKILEG